MARLVGIESCSTHARAAVLQSQYRGFKLVAFRQVEVQPDQPPGEALQQLLLPLVQQGDHVSCCLSGDSIFVREIELPAAAAKQLEDVVPYEIEAQVPIDLDELCFDYRALPKREGTGALPIFAAAARMEVVRQQIDLMQAALGVEPERIAAGALPLANLALVVAELREAEPTAVLDLGMDRSDFVVLESGRPVFARTLSVGAGAGADSLISALRQSRAAWLQRGGKPLSKLFLTGAGAAVDGACPLLSDAMKVDVEPLPKLELEGENEGPGVLVGFEKVIGAALGLTPRAVDLNLRRGSLAYQHSYEFLKSKAPTLAALAAVLILSFTFSVWAESRSLSKQTESLRQVLGAMTEQTLGERIETADEMMDLLDRGGARAEEDPQPQMDAFSVLVAVSERIDKDIVHDIEEFDVQGAKVKIVGIVSTFEEAEKIESAFAEHECFRDVKISKRTQVVGSDRKKYSLSFEVDCDKARGSAKSDKERG